MKRNVAHLPLALRLALSLQHLLAIFAGTVFVPLVPWSAAGAYMVSCLGVETLEYLPWAILCYTGFLFAIFYGFTGIGIAKLSDEEKAKYEAEKAAKAAKS